MQDVATYVFLHVRKKFKAVIGVQSSIYIVKSMKTTTVRKKGVKCMGFILYAIECCNEGYLEGTHVVIGFIVQLAHFSWNMKQKISTSKSKSRL